MLNTIAVPLVDQLAVFEFGVICEVFGGRRNDPDIPDFDFRVCGVEAGVPLTTAAGPQITPVFDLSIFDDADLIAVPAASIRTNYPPELLAALRRADAEGKTILSICSGAFILGAAGLLDGRDCATHWKYIDELRARHPSARVHDDVLYVEDGNLVTSAGTAAGVDASLHIIRKELGMVVANTLARHMVVAPVREGDQRQYIERPVPRDSKDGVARVLEHMTANLGDDFSIAELADYAHMSRRSFTRRFAQEAGTTPMKWLASQRLLASRHLLETTALDLESIARDSGFGSASIMRKHYRTQLGTTPTLYRRDSQRTRQSE